MIPVEAMAMERSDSRLLPVAALNERRRRAVVLRLSGMELAAACALSELSKSTVIAVVKAYHALDNLPVHKQPPVTAWLEGHRDKIEVFYLPSYSPELNPDELLNADLKEALTKRAPACRKGELKKAVISHLRRITKSPDRVKKYFAHGPVKYAA
jgi:hypothetical protein